VSSACGWPWPLPRSWTAATLNGLSHRKSSLVVGLLSGTTISSCKSDMVWGTGRIPHSLLLLQILAPSCQLCLYIVHGNGSWFLVHAGFCRSRLRVRCFITAESDSPPVINPHFSKKGVRGTENPWKVTSTPRGKSPGDPQHYCSRHFSKRRSGCVILLFFDGQSETEKQTEGHCDAKNSRVTFSCSHPS
jgi:hypothetical protein